MSTVTDLARQAPRVGPELSEKPQPRWEAEAGTKTVTKDVAY